MNWVYTLGQLPSRKFKKIKNQPVNFQTAFFIFYNSLSPPGKSLSFCPSLPDVFNNQLDIAGLSLTLKTTLLCCSFRGKDVRKKKKKSHLILSLASSGISQISPNHSLVTWYWGQLGFFVKRGRRKRKAGERQPWVVCCLRPFNVFFSWHMFKIPTLSTLEPRCL